MQALDKIDYSNNWVTILLFVLLVGVVFLKLLNAKKLKQNVIAFFNNSLLDDSDVDGLNYTKPFQIIIFLFTVTVLSLLTHTFKIYKLPETATNFVVFSTIFGCVLLYLFLKRMLEYGLSLLFMIKKNVRPFINSKINTLHSISFFLYIALVLNEYANLNRVYLFYFASFLFIMRFIFLVARNKKLIFNQLFYFILYICAFEIATLFVLYKLMF
ncbi:DUF4271 domain-containing protein [Polaribacter vadi]|uniref:DUF4271 domain-containing protein n=1 Tax=Polaribacter TaxID=52959 RepID=UPI001C0A2E20|nr:MULTISPECIES: DUF4271 domain-containing protein [Polaribacter]MBU3011513.1 DUF4271 domain-containing protein [Polaribacter vadi]MDO6741325.1 DUF4271 domain-containing protein [Polaribacter sp. 1_MG-2023]